MNKCQVAGTTYRISVLTSRLIRIEYSKTGTFEDRKTTMAVNRDFSPVVYTTEKTEDGVSVITQDLKVFYDGRPFSAQGLHVQMLSNPYTHLSTWYYGDEVFSIRGNLKGTASTLDRADGDRYVSFEEGVNRARILDRKNGEIDMGAGLMSQNGFSILDDSDSSIITEDGDMEPGLTDHQDLYFFGYGREYYQCLQDFYHLSGHTPMLPRFALGNWWSRYFKYTQESYLNLMERFEREKLPFSVSVLDMDWHYVDIDPHYGNGWTGYTWNKELFPDHKKMLAQLHDMGKKVTLNVHPADGIRGFEDCYASMAKQMGCDSSKGQPIAFDIADQTFRKAYFSSVHHPLEAEGVDFWWIDWQQGSGARKNGTDPLWALNYYHYRDSEKNNKRGLIFSRYAGPGSHRYPIGFSGDSIISWKSLDFQPYFTATASNVGYGWWSHDIGGHMRGGRDDELETRWVQFGVFSPIMRLHSSSNPFSGKEPWKYGMEAEAAMDRFLRLRHQMLPYLYTMNYRAYKEGIPLMLPMYYDYPNNQEAYLVHNQYTFGSQMMVHPVTRPMDTCTRMGCTKTWLPDGIWYDLFTGVRYTGGRMVKMYRPLDSIPVLAKAGAIIPMQPEETVSNDTANPKELLLLVCAGTDGTFTMYEDDGESLDYRKGQQVETTFTLDWKKKRELVISSAQGATGLIPDQRKYRIVLYGHICGMQKESGWRAGSTANTVVYETEWIGTDTTVRIALPAEQELPQNPILENTEQILNRAQTSYEDKKQLYEIVSHSAGNVAVCISQIDALEADPDLKESIKEQVLAAEIK